MKLRILSESGAPLMGIAAKPSLSGQLRAASVKPETTRYGGHTWKGCGDSLGECLNYVVSSMVYEGSWWTQRNMNTFIEENQ